MCCALEGCPCTTTCQSKHQVADFYNKINTSACLAGKTIPVAVQLSASAASEAPSATAAAGAVEPAKAKTKKVPRYVKEALREVEEEKASKLASAQQEGPMQTALKKMIVEPVAAAAEEVSKVTKQLLKGKPKSKANKATKKAKPS